MKGHYTNFQNVRLCFPLKLKSAADNDSDITAGLMTVNNFFLRIGLRKLISKGTYFTTN